MEEKRTLRSEVEVLVEKGSDGKGEEMGRRWVHCKKGFAVFPSPAGMSLIKLFLGGNNLVFPAQREFDQ